MSIKQLRLTLRASRREITGAARRRFAELISEHLARYLPFRRAGKVAFYAATSEEVDTAPAIGLAEALGKEIYLPVINRMSWRNGRMLFAPYKPGVSPLKQNRHGILEPNVPIGRCVTGTSLDMVCVPLVGFNSLCDRIGMGQGYYDEAFSSASFRKTMLIGLAYDCQRASFEPAAHDVPLDAVITETGIMIRK